MALEQLEFLNACYPHKTATDAITALTQALATTEPTKAELIAQARDLIEAQEHAHEVGYRMGFAAATEPTSESSSLESTRTKKG